MAVSLTERKQTERRRMLIQSYEHGTQESLVYLQ